MSNEFFKLFEPDLIFIECFNDANEAFEKISDKLFRKGLVKSDYIKALKKREKEFPTGIDLSVVGPNLPNVAIPHTESEYCNETKVIVVKLKNELNFKNMMNSSENLNVKYLFMILNEAGGEQANILANIMKFITNRKNIDKLEESNSIEEIYKILNQ